MQQHPSSGAQSSGDGGYEFSFRPNYGTRLFVYVPEDALAIFQRRLPEGKSSLSIIGDHADALRAMAVARCSKDNMHRLVVSPEDAQSILEAHEGRLASWAGPSTKV